LQAAPRPHGDEHLLECVGPRLRVCQHGQEISSMLWTICRSSIVVMIGLSVLGTAFIPPAARAQTDTPMTAKQSDPRTPGWMTGFPPPMTRPSVLPMAIISRFPSRAGRSVIFASSCQRLAYRAFQLTSEREQCGERSDFLARLSGGGRLFDDPPVERSPLGMLKQSGNFIGAGAGGSVAHRCLVVRVCRRGTATFFSGDQRRSF
jgi:hypothetical protein